MNALLLNHFIYIIILLSAFMAHSDNSDSKECQPTFAPQTPRIETLKNVIVKSLNKKSLEPSKNSSYSQKRITQARDLIQYFLEFLDSETLELKDTTNEELSQNMASKLRKLFLDREDIDSQVLEKIDPDAFRKKFLKAYDYKRDTELPPYVINFVKFYIENPSFRREVYKFEMFTMLFGDIFQDLSYQQISTLVSPQWKVFFIKHANKVFRNKKVGRHQKGDLQEWRFRLQDFIELTQEELESQKK